MNTHVATKLITFYFKKELTNRGCVDKCLLEILDPCKDEIQPHINTDEGNIEHIFKILKGLFLHL